jgi:hypothetical protein
LRRFQAELLINATGTATARKFELQEAQLTAKLKEWALLDKFDVLDFQWVGRPQSNPTCQLASTTYLRIFAQAVEKEVIGKLLAAWAFNSMQHFSGLSSFIDLGESLTDDQQVSTIRSICVQLSQSLSSPSIPV